MAEHAATESSKGHANKSTYWLIAVILGIITMLEVAVFYVPLLHSVIVPLLLVLSTAKFVLVAMFFMHLKFDKPILTTVVRGRNHRSDRDHPVDDAVVRRDRIRAPTCSSGQPLDRSRTEQERA